MAAVQTVFSIEAVDTMGNVGQWTSLAIDGQGAPHIAYTDVTLIDPKYAFMNGSAWNVQTVNGGSWQVGRRASLVLDEDSNPHISCTGGSSLVYFRRTAGAWDGSLVDGPLSPSFSYTTIGFDGSGAPSIIFGYYSLFRDEQELGVATEVEVDGDWETSVVSFGELGYTASGAFDSEGSPHMISTNSSCQMHYVRRSGSTWTMEMVDAATFACGFSSLAIDADGNPHVSYPSLNEGDLRYAEKTNGLWSVETVDASPNDVGVHNALSLDDLGNPHISYYDATSGDLLYATRKYGFWVLQLVDGLSSDVGEYNAIKVGGDGRVHISYYDRTGRDLKYAVSDAPTAVVSLLRDACNLSVSPNPAQNGWTVIGYGSPSGTPVELAIFDVTGRRIVTLVRGTAAPRGSSVTWNAVDEARQSVPSGTYFVRLTVGAGSEVRKLTLVK